MPPMICYFRWAYAVDVSWRHKSVCFDKSSSCWLKDSTQLDKRRNPTSSSMLRAATELNSLKSIREDASVRRKLPSARES